MVRSRTLITIINIDEQTVQIGWVDINDLFTE